MFNIAIDGPAGAGKSTIAKLVAKNKGFIYVDTGAMYRTMALACLRKNVDFSHNTEIIDVCKKVNIELKYIEGEQRVYLDGEDVSVAIRQEEVGNAASKVAVISDVRRILVAIQQELAKKNNVVMDGRDIGSVVLPNANLKIYLTASVKCRAKRRYDELTEKNMACHINQIEKDIEERDYRDMNRAESPLVKVEDAVLIDSSDLTVDEVVNKIIQLSNTME